MARTATCTFEFLIPLEPKEAMLFVEAFNLVNRHLSLDHISEDQSLDDEDPALAYEKTLASAPAREANAARSEVAESIVRALWRNACDEHDFYFPWLELCVRGGTSHGKTGVLGTTRMDAWGRVQGACALIEAAQQALGAGPTGFTYHNDIDGCMESAGVAVYYPQSESFDLESLVAEKVREYEEAGDAEVAAEAASAPAA